MEKEEKILAAPRITGIQLVDPPAGQGKQGRVFRHDGLRRIAEIGEQAEMQVLIAIGEKADLQRLDQILDPGSAGQHGWDDNQVRAAAGTPSE